jgi:hypothetical protein
VAGQRLSLIGAIREQGVGYQRHLLDQFRNADRGETARPAGGFTSRRRLAPHVFHRPSRLTGLSVIPYRYRRLIVSGYTGSNPRGSNDGDWRDALPGSPVERTCYVPKRSSIALPGRTRFGRRNLAKSQRSFVPGHQGNQEPHTRRHEVRLSALVASRGNHAGAQAARDVQRPNWATGTLQRQIERAADDQHRDTDDSVSAASSHPVCCHAGDYASDDEAQD